MLGRQREVLDKKIQGALDRRILGDLRREPPGPVPEKVDAATPAGRVPLPPAKASSSSLAKPKPLVAPSSDDLVATLAKRLADAERESASHRATVRKQEEKISALQAEVRSLKAQLSAAATVAALEEASIGHENEQLRDSLAETLQEASELKQLLLDYGMVWVGHVAGDEPGPEAPEGMWQVPSVPSRSAATASTSAASVPAAASAASAADRSKPGLPPLKIDITLLRKNAEQLSYVAGEGQSHVATGPGGERRLRKVEALELIVYADGFALGGGAFRSTSTESGRAFVQDLLDNYFPYELKEQYPDGVPFALVDRSGVNYEATFGRRFRPFEGRGVLVGAPGAAGAGGGGVSGAEGRQQQPRPQQQQPQARGGGSSLPSIVHDLRSAPSSSAAAAAAAPAEGARDAAFLARLPPVVLRGGSVVDVRGEIAEMLRGRLEAAPGPSTPLTDATSQTAASSAALSRPQSALGASIRSRGEVTMLRIKSEDSKQTFVLKMHFNDTIADLRAALARARGSAAQSADYEIRTAFPPTTFSDLTQTLQQAGLVPNAALLLVSAPGAAAKGAAAEAAKPGGRA